MWGGTAGPVPAASSHRHPRSAGHAPDDRSRADRRAAPRRGTTLAAMPDQPRVIVVMPAYNAAKTLERTYADIPAGLVDHVILVDDVSKDETVDIARQIGLEVHRPRPEQGLRRQPEDVLRRGPRRRRRRRRDAPPRLPVRRDADPRAHRADPVGRARPDAGQPLPGRPAGGRHAQVEVRLEPVPDRGREPRLRAPALRVPHGPARLQPAPARGDPVSPELRRLRVRPGADRPGRRRGRAEDRRDRRARRATSRRRARSGSSGASSTGCPRCGSWLRYLLHRTGLRRSREARAAARPRGRDGAGAGAREPSGHAGQLARADPPGARGIAHLGRRAVARRRDGRPRGGRRGARARPTRAGSRCWWRSSASTSSCGPSAGGCCSRRCAPCRSRRRSRRCSWATSPTTSCPHGWASSIRCHVLGDRTGLSRSTILGTVVVERIVDTAVVVAIAAFAILVLSVRGIVAQRPSAWASRSPRCWSSAWSRRWPPTGCPAPSGSRRGSPRRPELRADRWRGCARASRWPAGRRRWSRRVALSVAGWSCSVLGFAAAAQAVGVEPTMGQAALLAAGTNLATAIPVGPGLHRHVRAGRGDDRDVGGPARGAGARVRADRPRGDDRADLARWRDRRVRRVGVAANLAPPDRAQRSLAADPLPGRVPDRVLEDRRRQPLAEPLDRQRASRGRPAPPAASRWSGRGPTQ